MADKQSREVIQSGERALTASEARKRLEESLKVKVELDVSEAITGLKALQREAKEATKALREVEFSVSSKANTRNGEITINLHVDSVSDPKKLADSIEKAIRNLPKDSGM